MKLIYILVYFIYKKELIEELIKILFKLNKLKKWKLKFAFLNNFNFVVNNKCIGTMSSIGM